jgi:hypothetical protein
LDEDTWLVVGVGGKGLGLFGWDSGVSLDQSGHDATSGFNSEGEWCDIEEEEILDGLVFVSGEDSGLDGSTVGNSLIRVDGFVQTSSVEEVFQEFLDLWDSGGTTDKDELVDLRFVQFGVSERFLDWLEGSSEEIGAKFFESGSGDAGVEIDTFEQGVDFDGGLGGSRQGPLRSFASGPQSSEGSFVGGQVLLVLSLEFLNKVVDHSVVEIFASQMSITSGGFNFEDTVFDGQDGDIEGSSAQIKDKNVLFTGIFFVQTVGDGSRGRFVNDSENVQTGDGTSIFGGLSLRIVEVSWDGDNGVVHLLSEVSFGDFLHFDENHRRDFFWEEFFGFTFVVYSDLWFSFNINNIEWPMFHIGLNGGISKFSADKSFGVEDCVGWVHGDLVFGGISDQSFGIVESNVRWGGSVTLVVGDNFDFTVLEDTDARVRGSEIDTDSRHIC